MEHCIREAAIGLCIRHSFDMSLSETTRHHICHKHWVPLRTARHFEFDLS